MYYRTLVLNQDYIPISIFPLHTISWQKAMIRLSAPPTVTVVAEYEEYIPTGGRHKIRYPAVVARTNYLKRDKIPSFRAESIWYRDNKHCAYCNILISDKKNITLDHVVPSYKGGVKTWDNIVLACATCNGKKGNSLPKGQWEPKYAFPWKPTYGQLIKIRKKFPIIIGHKSWLDFLNNWDAKIIIRNK